jgi:hypothetical protein
MTNLISNVAWTCTRWTLIAVLSPVILTLAAHKALVNWTLDGDVSDERYIH